MANKEKLTPADYDRWGHTCVRFYEDSPQKAEDLNGQPITSKPEAATAKPKPPPKLKATAHTPQNAKKLN